MNKKINMGVVLNNFNYNDKRRTTALVLDVETALSKGNEQLIFDIGWTISSVSNEQMVMHQSYIVEEIFLDMSLMERAYYFNKYPEYVRALADGRTQLKPFNEIIKILNGDIKDLNVKTLYAYNAKFDSTAITKTHRYINNNKSELIYDIKCLWSLSAQTFMATKKFVLTAFDNNWLTEKGNIKTSAEIAHRYLTKDVDFVESHTGLEDSVIEPKILWAINRQGKKKDKDCKQQPWRRIKKLKDEMGL